MGWNKVYILIMGSIRSFDGRNCKWLIKYTRAVSVSPVSPFRGHTVATLLAHQIPPRGVRCVWCVFRGHTVASVY